MAQHHVGSGALTWDDYIERGALEAIRAAREISGGKLVNALGFCVGGTLLACTLAVLAARRHAYVASATFLTTMLDFTDPGEIGVYITREGLAAREPVLMTGQRVHGSELANAFASLRANELVWNYVVNNYLKGRTPPAFDLLYWNGDSSNLPGPMYVYYLREMYLDNRLREPNALTMAGARIDLSKIRMPVYVYASRDDHIVPWRSAYRTTALVGGEATFVLGASGHIAGVVNPPVAAEAQLLGQGGARRRRRRVARRRAERARQLVAALVPLARAARRCATLQPRQRRRRRRIRRCWPRRAPT